MVTILPPYTEEYVTDFPHLSHFFPHPGEFEGDYP